MQLVKGSDTNTTETGVHRFIVNLKAHNGKSVEVRSCEVVGPNFRNRFSFPMRVTIEDVFVGAIAKGVRQCLSSLSNKTEVVSLPSVSIEIPGVSLAMAHLIATEASDGSLGIILRFKMLLGTIGLAFHPDLGIEDNVADHSAHTSALVLADIVMPLLDICAAAEVDGLKTSTELETFIDTLLARSNEVRFQAELVKRYVANSESLARSPRRQLRRKPKMQLVGSDPQFS